MRTPKFSRKGNLFAMLLFVCIVGSVSCATYHSKNIRDAWDLNNAAKVAQQRRNLSPEELYKQWDEKYRTKTETETAPIKMNSEKSDRLSKEIPLERQGGVYELPLKINGVITLKFILDSGASEVNIPVDVASTLLRTGTISQGDFLHGKSYRLADGSILKSLRFIIRELDLGGIKISNVPASIGPAAGSLLLGQSFLERLESWSLDNKRHVFIVGGAIQHR